MKIIQLPRGGGKTTEMLMWLLHGHSDGIDRALIVATVDQAQQLKRQLHGLYNDYGQPQYINKAANRIYALSAVLKLGKGHFSKCEVGVDNADMILNYFLFGNTIHRPISIASVTTHSEDTKAAGKSVSLVQKAEEFLHD